MLNNEYKNRDAFKEFNSLDNLKKLDKNKDGKIDLKEINFFDVDGSNSLNGNEFSDIGINSRVIKDEVNLKLNNLTKTSIKANQFVFTIKEINKKIDTLKPVESKIFYPSSMTLKPIKEILSNLIVGKIPENEQSNFVASSLGISDTSKLGTMRKIELALKKVPEHLSTELKEKCKEFFQPENLKIIAGVTALYGGSHLIGVGEILDVLLTGVGIASLGMDSKKVALNIYNSYNIINEAKTDKDLDNAAKEIAKGLTTVLTDIPLGVGTYKGVKNIQKIVNENKGITASQYLKRTGSEVKQNVQNIPKTLGIQKTYLPSKPQKLNDIKRDVLVPVNSAFEIKNTSFLDLFRIKKGISYEYLKNPSAKNFPSDFSLDIKNGLIKSRKSEENVSSKFMYVVDQNNNIIIGNRNKLIVYSKNGKTIIEGDKIPFTGDKLKLRQKELTAQNITFKTISHPHTTLIGGTNPKVKAAGMVQIEKGKIKSINLESGHYRPKNNTILEVEKSFKKIDPKFFSKSYKGIIPYESESIKLNIPLVSGILIDQNINKEHK